MKSISDLILLCKMNKEEDDEDANYDKLLFIQEINKMPWPKFNEICKQLLALDNGTSNPRIFQEKPLKKEKA
ncbi:MAG TPA: hypothetical protein VN721_17420 [Flavipsychrobacter sp.]|nr:hypothetical protein [Flavipsychrobacter sp.]